ncbi:MAG: anaerobic glycerol-3-phosphate dehydrogenase subunit GlpC [Thermodesulfobacteriota bacterium]
MIDLENTSFDCCIKCTICTAYCPVARATDLYPGPKYSGPDAERLRIKSPLLADHSLSFCNNCKRCETVCPSGVRITDFIYKAKGSRLKKSHRLRDFVLTRTDISGRLSAGFSWLVNPLMKLSVTRFFLSAFLAISRDAVMPAFDRGTFVSGFRNQAKAQEGFPRKVAYFHGCYVNYYDHALGNDVILVLNAMGIGVTAPRQKCCGVPLIAAGNFKAVRKNAAFNIASLGAAVADSDMKIVFSSSSCALTVTQDYPHLLAMDTSAIDDRLELLTRFLHREFAAGNKPAMGSLNLTAAYHSPCHLDRTGGVRHTIAVLQSIPGLRLILLHSECCGIAGTYGFKKEFHAIAQDIGHRLFDQIEQANPDIVITDCETCKWQIEANTRFPVRHPVSVLAEAVKKF